MRVLVVEDEPDLARTLKKALEEDGFVVDVAVDGEDGLHEAETGVHDVVVLDLMLPKLDGIAVLTKLRKTSKVPVLVLTARDAVADRVRGLDAGADDYLTKPFELSELRARLRSLLRRAAEKPSPLWTFGDLVMDTLSRTVTRGGKRIELSAKEYALLELFASNRGRIVTRSLIHERLWGDDEDPMSNVVDVYVAGLRRKVGKKRIVTRRGEGYVFDDA